MSRRVVFFWFLVVGILGTHCVAQENGMLDPRLVNPRAVTLKDHFESAIADYNKRKASGPVVIQDPATLKKVEFPDNPPENPAGYLRACFQSKYGEETLEQLMNVHDRLLSDFAKWETLSGEEKTKLENAYITQWTFLLTGSGMIDDVKIRNKIFDKFKDTLLYDGRHQDSMSYMMNLLVSMPYRDQTLPVVLESRPVDYISLLGIYYQGKYGEENLKQSMDVLDRLLGDFAKWETLSVKEKAKLEDEYFSLWLLLLTGSAMTDDVKIQNTVFDKFKEALRYDGRHQASMLCTVHTHNSTMYWFYRIPILRTAFARFYSYIKEDLWKLLERSENAAVINNLCAIALNNERSGRELDAEDWNKFVLKKATLAQQRITPETAMAIIELSPAIRGRDTREAEKKYGPTPDPNRWMRQAIPIQHHYPEVMRLVDMEQKMQIEFGKPGYKFIIQRMVQNNSAEGW